MQQRTMEFLLETRTALAGVVLGLATIIVAYDLRDFELTIVCGVMSVLIVAVVGYFQSKEYE